MESVKASSTPPIPLTFFPFSHGPFSVDMCQIFGGGGVTRNITCSSLDCFFLKFNPFLKHDRPYKFGEWIPKMMSLVKWYLLSIIASLVGGFNPFEKY